MSASQCWAATVLTAHPPLHRNSIFSSRVKRRPQWISLLSKTELGTGFDTVRLCACAGVCICVCVSVAPLFQPPKIQSCHLLPLCSARAAKAKRAESEISLSELKCASSRQHSYKSGEICCVLLVCTPIGDCSLFRVPTLNDIMKALKFNIRFLTFLSHTNQWANTHVSRNQKIQSRIGKIRAVAVFSPPS